MRQTRRDVLRGMIAAAALGVVPTWAVASGSQGATPGTAAARKGGANPRATSAAFDAQGRLWVATVEHVGQAGNGPAPSNIVLRWSADEGKTWSPAQNALRTPEPVEANGEGRPKLAFGAGGQMYLTFTRPLDKPHTGDIRFMRSTDGGASFSEPVTIQRDRDVTGHRFDSIIVDPDGRIFIAWIDKRDLNLARAAKRPYRGAAVYYAVSTDHGASFGQDVRVADHCCDCCRISLSLNAGGEVVAMWRHVFAPNARDHAMAVLRPSGAPAAPTRVTFEDWRIDACPHHGPSHAFDAAGRRHQVWFNAANDEGGVYFASASPAGELGKALRLGGAQAEHGEVAAAGSAVAVVWKEFDGQATRVHARVSPDGGASWQDRVLASSMGRSDHPHLVQRGSGIWLLWHTEKESLVIRRVEVTS